MKIGQRILIVAAALVAGMVMLHLGPGGAGHAMPALASFQQQSNSHLKPVALSKSDLPARPAASTVMPRPAGADSTARVTGMVYRVVSPAYTHRPPRDLILSLGESLNALVGTVVQVRVQGSVPLGGGAIVTPAAHRDGDQTAAGPQGGGWHVGPLAPDQADDHAVLGSFTVNSTGNVRVEVSDQHGWAVGGAVDVPVVADVDLPPTVRIMRPTGDIYARAGDVITVDMAADDDIGISCLQLERSLNGIVTATVDYPVSADQPRHLAMRAWVDLSQWRLSAGDTIELQAHVFDNDPVGAKRGDSQVLTVHILPSQSDHSVRRIMW